MLVCTSCGHVGIKPTDFGYRYNGAYLSHEQWTFSCLHPLTREQHVARLNKAMWEKKNGIPSHPADDYCYGVVREADSEAAYEQLIKAVDG